MRPPGPGWARWSAVVTIVTTLTLGLSVPAEAAAKPDLIVTGVNGAPPTIERGHSFELTVTTQNRGSVKAKPSTTGIYFSADIAYQAGEDMRAASQRVRGLQKRKSSTGAVEVVAPPELRLGTYHLLACADAERKVGEKSERNNCRAATGTVEVWNGASSFEKIQEAVDDGTIDRQTELRYRVFAAFGDPRLPSEYAGNDSGVRDDDALNGAFDEWDTLDQETKNTIAPFYIPPMYDGSWADDAQGSGAGSTDRRASSAAPDVDKIKNICGLLGDPQPKPQWRNIPTKNGKVLVWWNSDHGASEQSAARLLADAVDNRIWSSLKTLAGEALADSGSTVGCRGGDDRVDVVLGPLKGGVYGYAIKLSSFRSSAFLIVNRNKGFKKETLAHELLHAVQFGSPTAWNAEPWMREAAATFAEDYVYPSSNSEHEYVSEFLKHPEYSLSDLAGNHAYSAYLLFFFLDRSTGDPGILKRVWANLKDMDVMDAISAAVPGGLATQWPDFHAHNWGRGPFKGIYKEWDGISEQGPEIDKEGLFMQIGESEAEEPIPDLLSAMSAKYFRWHFAGSSVRELTFDSDLAWGGRVRVQAMYELPDHTWKGPFDWTGTGGLCRDRAAQNAKSLVLIVSNARKTAVDLESEKAKLTLRDSCGPTVLSGTLTYRDRADWQEDVDEFGVRRYEQGYSDDVEKVFVRLSRSGPEDFTDAGSTWSGDGSSASSGGTSEPGCTTTWADNHAWSDSGDVSLTGQVTSSGEEWDEFYLESDGGGHAITVTGTYETGWSAGCYFDDTSGNYSFGYDYERGRLCCAFSGVLTTDEEGLATVTFSDGNATFAGVLTEQPS